MYRKLFVFLLLSISLLGFGQMHTDYNCYSIIVGKNASADGSVLLAHNEDDGGEFLVDMHKMPRVIHKPSDVVKLSETVTISQPKETYSCLWIDMPGLEFSDSYINEYGVVVTSDQCQSRENSAEGILGLMLRKLIAERAKTAREGVKIAGELIEKYGYSYSGRTYCIADPNEGWAMAVVKGKHWVAQRVPDDEVMIIPNYYVIEEINLNDSANFLGSKDIVDYAINNGWYNPKEGKKFNFRLAYANPASLSTNINIARKWSVLNILSEKQYEYFDDFPFSFKPKEKVNLLQLMTVMKNHYEKTEFEMHPDFNNGNPHKNLIMRVCSEANQYCFIAQLRKQLPSDIGTIMWFTPARPCIHPFIPFYFGINSMPENYERMKADKAFAAHNDDITNNRKDFPKHASWVFADYAAGMDKDYKNKIGNVREYNDVLQTMIFNSQKIFEQDIIKIYNQKPAEAKKQLTEFSAKFAKILLEKTQSQIK